MAENADITVELLPIEQSQLLIEIKVCKLLSEMLYKNSELKYDGLPGELELSVNDLVKDLAQKTTELEIELEKYNSKQYTITIQTTDTTAPISRPVETEQTNEQ